MSDASSSNEHRVSRKRPRLHFPVSNHRPIYPAVVEPKNRIAQGTIVPPPPDEAQQDQWAGYHKKTGLGLDCPIRAGPDGYELCSWRPKDGTDGFPTLIDMKQHVGAHGMLCPDCERCFTRFTHFKTHRQYQPCDARNADTRKPRFPLRHNPRQIDDFFGSFKTNKDLAPSEAWLEGYKKLHSDQALHPVPSSSYRANVASNRGNYSVHQGGRDSMEISRSHTPRSTSRTPAPMPQNVAPPLNIGRPAAPLVSLGGPTGELAASAGANGVRQPDNNEVSTPHFDMDLGVTGLLNNHGFDLGNFDDMNLNGFGGGFVDPSSLVLGAESSQAVAETQPFSDNQMPHEPSGRYAIHEPQGPNADQDPQAISHGLDQVPSQQLPANGASASMENSSTVSRLGISEEIFQRHSLAPGAASYLQQEIADLTHKIEELSGYGKTIQKKTRSCKRDLNIYEATHHGNIRTAYVNTMVAMFEGRDLF